MAHPVVQTSDGKRHALVQLDAVILLGADLNVGPCMRSEAKTHMVGGGQAAVAKLSVEVRTLLRFGVFDKVVVVDAGHVEAVQGQSGNWI